MEQEVGLGIQEVGAICGLKARLTKIKSVVGDKGFGPASIQFGDG